MRNCQKIIRFHMLIEKLYIEAYLIRKRGERSIHLIKSGVIDRMETISMSNRTHYNFFCGNQLV